MAELVENVQRITNALVSDGVSYDSKNHLIRIQGPINKACADKFYQIYSDRVEHSTQLVVELTTTGGSSFWAQLIASILAYHEGESIVRVPFYAMSAGTLIALSASRIEMTPYACLGPVDSQLAGWSLSDVMGWMESVSENLNSYGESWWGRSGGCCCSNWWMTPFAEMVGFQTRSMRATEQMESTKWDLIIHHRHPEYPELIKQNLTHLPHSFQMSAFRLRKAGFEIYDIVKPIPFELPPTDAKAARFLASCIPDLNDGEGGGEGGSEGVPDLSRDTVVLTSQELQATQESE